MNPMAPMNPCCARRGSYQVELGEQVAWELELSLMNPMNPSYARECIYHVQLGDDVAWQLTLSLMNPSIPRMAERVATTWSWAMMSRGSSSSLVVPRGCSHLACASTT